MSESLPAALRRRIDDCGYFPQLVADSMELALAGERVCASAVQHEATFDRDQIARHLTVLVLTPTRLLIGHTDENDDVPGEPRATSTTESIPLGKINGVALTRVVTRPERFRGDRRDAVVETWLTLGWGTMNRVDLEPAGCSDPNCDADHGYTGDLVSDDLTVRVSAAADGADTVAELVAFGSALQLATGARP